MSAPTPKRSTVAERDAMLGKAVLTLHNEVVFKRLFSDHLSLLSDLINVLCHPAAKLVLQKVLNPIILPKDLDGKEVVLDIQAKDTDG